MSSIVPAADYLSASYVKTFFLQAGDSPKEYTCGAVLSVHVKS